MTHMTFRDDEEEKEDEDAAIADDALDEIGDDSAVDDGLDTELALAPAADEDDEDEKIVDFDRHDDIDPI